MSFLGVRNGISVAVQAAVSFATGKLFPSLSLNFTGVSELPSSVTFSRGTQATMYASDGTVQYAPNNLLTYSEQFDNAAWLVARCTISANTTPAPDGTATADSLVEDTTNNSHPVYRTVGTLTPAIYTGSCYIKAAGRTQARIALASTAFPTSPYVDFDLSAVTATGANGGAGTITAVGNGWFRCTAAATASVAGSGDMYIQPVLAGAATYLGTGITALYLWGAQLAQGSIAQPYNATTSAAYYGPRLEYDPASYVYQNLLLQSQAFDTASWNKSGFIVTADATTAPDGTNTADLITAGAVSDNFFNNSVISLGGGSYTASVYVKAGTSPSMSIGLYNQVTPGFFALVQFVFATQAISVLAGSVTASSATSLGNGWYRLAFTTTTTVVASANVFVYGRSTGSGNVVGDSFYLWGAQLNAGSSALPYYPTTTAAYTQCTPRGLLIEEARTNLLVRSEEFDNGWNLQNLTITANASVSPDGNTNADKAVITASSAYTSLRTPNITVTPSTTYTFSFWLNTTTSLAGNTIRVFNITGGTDIVSGQACVYSGGWVRQTCTFTTPVGCTTIQAYAVSLNAGPSTAGSFFDVWGAQLEAGAFATSYIPTVAATVTRNADNASMTGTNFSSWFNATAGTFVAQFDLSAAPLGTGNKGVYCAYGSASNNIVSYATNSGGALADVILDGGVAQAAFTSVATLSANTVYKDALAYAANNFARSLNAAAPQTDATGTVPTGLTVLRLGWDDTANPSLNGHIRSISYYPTRLTDAQLQALTV